MSQATQQAQSPAHDQYREQRTEQVQKQGRSLAEWVSFGIASSILLALVSLIIYDWAVTSQAAPIVHLYRSGEVREAANQFYVPFEVQNVGGEAAEAIQVLAELKVDGQVIEEGEQQIDFLSSGEIAKGAFVFTQDPSEAELLLRIGSYKLP